MNLKTNLKKAKELKNNMKFQIKHRLTGEILIEGEAENFKEFVEKNNANLSYADLSYANLSYAYLYNANLSDANLSYAYLYNANLSNANLSYADLSYANL